MSKKKRKLGDHADDYMREDKPETFGNREYEDELFDLLEGEEVKVTSDEISIMSIHADPLQPRRIIPGEIRDDWDGDPAKMPGLLQAWAELLYDSGNDLPIVKILRGQEEPAKYLTGDKFVDSFIALLNLAAGIRKVGLNQRIGIRPIPGDNYRIIFGERRWTAFHLLNHFLPDEDHNHIPAKVADVSEWQIRSMQVSENNQREDTNAISKAREFALLLITARSDTDDYDPPHTLNSPACDRPWYAQIANGEIHRIPRGMGPDFEQVLGISLKQMRRYRSLLKLTDDYEVNNTIWNLADNNDWAERFMRDIDDYLEIETIREILYRPHGGGIENASQAEEAFREAIHSAKSGAALAKKKKQRDDQPYLNRWVQLDSGFVGQVIRQQGTAITLEDLAGDIIETTTHNFIDTDVTPRSNKSDDPVNEPETDDPDEPTDSTLSEAEQRIAELADIYSDGKRVGLLLTNDNGTLVGGTRGTVVNRDRLLGVMFDGSELITQYIVVEGEQSHILEHVDFDFNKQADKQTEDDTASDNPSSLPSDTVHNVAQWIGKPAIYNDEPCIVLKQKHGMPGHVVIQSGKERITVPVWELKPSAADPQTKVTDFISGTGNKSSDTPPAGDDTPPVQSTSTIGTTGDLMLHVKARNFINAVTLDAAAEGLPFSDIARLYKIRDTEIAPADLPELLEASYSQIEAYADHLKQKAETLFKDIANQYLGDTDD